jgi:KDO2-lipid IV(A) lauroyltransferase
MSALFRFFSRWPLWLLHPLGAALGWAVFALSPTYRRRFLANSALAGYSFAQVRAAVAHGGRMVAELPRLWFGVPPPLIWEGAGLLDAACARGRGIVFLTPHLGCFEVTAQGFADRYAPDHGPLVVLYRPPRHSAMAKVLEGARERPGLETAPTTLSGVRQMIKALRAGGAVGLLPDQVPPEGMGQWAPFFGQAAYTMTLGARLAAQTGATVLLVWGERLPWGRGFRLHFREPEQRLSDNQELAVMQINQEMERLIRECPQQYLWGYGRYKQPRRDPVKELG